MSLSTSNTYITPTNTTGIGIARGQINGSLRAISQNFYSKAAPVSTNISDDGTLVDPYPGTLYFSSNSFALYRMSESTVSGGYYSTQKFTRRGISYRTEIDSTSATANITSGYETGEMYFRLSDDTYWFRNSTGTAVQFQTGAAATVGDGAITPVKLAAASYIQYNTSGQFALNNAIATSATVRSDTILSIRNAATQFPNPSLFIEPSSHGTSRHARIDIDNWAFRQDHLGSGTKDLGVVDKTAGSLRLYLDTSGRFGVGSSTSLTSTFTVGGTMTASGITTLTATTATTSTSTGALVVSGGVGIASNAFVGGNVAISSGLASSSSTTGALVVTGGVGIGGAINAGGLITSNSGGFRFPDSTTQTTAAPTGFTNLGSGEVIFSAISGSNAQLKSIRLVENQTTSGTNQNLGFSLTMTSPFLSISSDSTSIVLTYYTLKAWTQPAPPAPS